MNKILFLAFMILSIGQLSAQVRYTDPNALIPKKKLPSSYRPLSVTMSYTVAQPGADLSKRFGLTMSVGGGIEYIALPKGWFVSADVHALFGNAVREDVIAPLRTAEGEILSDINNYASVSLRLRGMLYNLQFGKLIKLFDNGNKFGGLRIAIGGAHLSHRIRIQDDNNSAPQLDGAYGFGYDRATAGFALTQFLGFQMVSRDKTINFFAGIQTTQGFTKSLRQYNFDTRSFDLKKRLDLLYAFKIGWSLPIFTNQTADDIEY
jgi:hypothetical protein